MSHKSFTMLRSALATLALGALMASSVPAPAGAASALAGLVGSWGGGGSASFEGGSREKLTCNGYYRGGGDNLSMVIRCASAGGAKIELRGLLKDNGGKVSGTWEERTYNATGTISGAAGPGNLKVGITGAVSGSLQVSFTQTSQTVAIATQGTALRSVNINFGRR